VIIDVHSHLYRSNSSAASWWLAGEPDGPVPIARYVAHAVAQPVDLMFMSADPQPLDTPSKLSDANDAVASAVALAPGRLVGQCQVLPGLIEASLVEMEKHIARGAMRGIGELCQYLNDYEPDAPGLFPLIERAAELDVPVLYHASKEEHTRGLDRLASMFPRARFIMAHIGGMSNWWNGIDVSRSRDNVWVDTSGFVLLCYGALRRALAILGPSKILFGVDFPLVPAAALLAALDSETLRSDERERIVSGNAVELFRLDGEGDPC
jgi:hypothetical protein